MNLTETAQRALQDNLPVEDLLPTRMPIYVNSMSYLFGVSALSALGILVLTGVLLGLFGPAWYHGSQGGHFVNSLHFWGAQVFFGTLLMHLITKFLMAAWRDGRWKTWGVGVLAFGIATFTGLTGFLLQGNWDAQWIAVQAKDAVNALGAGALFNPMNTGQVLTLHVVVLPLVVVVLVGVHLYFIRAEGPVKPL
jgi:quinol-cytochrome oxidoreductase complex cytochrome b subunit